GRGERVGRADIGDPVAALGDVAVPAGGAARCRALHVRRARGRRPGAVLGEIAVTGRVPAHHGGRGERVGRAGIGNSVAALGDVAVPGGGAARRRALHVCGARGGRPRAVLREI